MTHLKITQSEVDLIEHNNEFNGCRYHRKQYAYKKRAESICTHTREEWLEVCSFFGFVCCNCETDVIGGIPTKDHIYPITLGGSDSIRNLQPLCRQCNTSKFQKFKDYRLEYCERHGLKLPRKWRFNGRLD